MHFTLTIDVTAHARQQIASGDATQGNLIYPPGSGIVLGSWQFESACS
jgi:hypothetical protein